MPQNVATPKNIALAGAAVQALGLGDMLGEQVQGETEETRRKRMQQRQGGLEGNAARDLLGMSAAGGFEGLGGYGAPSL